LSMNWPNNKQELCDLGVERIDAFCVLNNIPTTLVGIVDRNDWPYGVCAYYRPDTGIKICLDKCQNLCGHAESRNWTWPGSTTDREPFGVLAHELGHHVDWLTSEKKGAYYGDYSITLRHFSGEKQISGYCDNDHEWFAEMFRVFITNPDLLRLLRPKTYTLLIEKWKPICTLSWKEALGDNVPDRVIRTLTNKGAKSI
jgi:hypothetical protein